MKRWMVVTLSFAFLLSSFSFTLARAQSDESQTVASTSGRFSIEVPSDWVVDNDLLNDYGDSETLWGDVLITANSQDMLDRLGENNFDPFSDKPEGAYVVVLMLSLAGESMTELSADQLVDSLLMASEGVFDEDEVEKVQLELRGISGLALNIASADVSGTLFVTSNDSTALLMIAMGQSDYAEIIQEAVDSFTFNSYDEAQLLDSEALTHPYEILPDFASINLPAGWWLFAEDTDNLVLLPSIELLEENYDFLDQSLGQGSLAFAGLQFDEYEIDSAKEALEGDITLEGMFNQLLGGEFGGGIEIEAWEGVPGLSGLRFTINVNEEEILAMGYFLEGDGTYYAIAGVYTAETQAEFQPFVEAVLATIQRVESDN